MEIVYVEDDPVQAESLMGEIRAQFAGTEILHFDSEWSFLNALPRLTRKPYLFIFDHMLRWSTLNQLMDAGKLPDGWQSAEAGLRLLRITRCVYPPAPIILFSVIQPRATSRFRPPDYFVEKDGGFAKLIITMRSIRTLTHEPPPAPTQIARKLLEALQAKPSFAGFAIDLKAIYEIITKRRKR